MATSRTKASAAKPAPSVTPRRKRETPDTESAPSGELIPMNTQEQLLLDREAKRTADVLLQPMQSVVLNPQTGRVTKRMLLSWLYILKHCQLQQPATSYKFPMAALMRFLGSKDYDDIRNDLKSLNATQVEWHSVGAEEFSWGVSSLLAQVEIRGSRGGNTIEIVLPPKVEHTLREKRAFSELNLLIAKELRSTAALNLYRIIIAYESSPSHLTFRAAPEDWEPRLSGAPRKAGTKFEYKFWKRDTLRPAIAEINMMCDVDVDLIEHKQGNWVKEIQFRVTTKPQSSLLLEDGESPAIEALTELERIGIRHSDAMIMLRNFGADRIMRNIEYTQKRESELGNRMRDFAKYLKSAIRQDYASEKEPIDHEPVPKARSGRAAHDTAKRRSEQAEKVRAEYIGLRRTRAEEMYAEMSKAQASAMWNEYLEALEESSRKALLRPARDKGLRDRMVKVDFFTWLAEKTWGEVTTEDLFDYLIAKQERAV